MKPQFIVILIFTLIIYASCGAQNFGTEITNTNEDTDFFSEEEIIKRNDQQGSALDAPNPEDSVEEQVILNHRLPLMFDWGVHIKGADIQNPYEPIGKVQVKIDKEDNIYLLGHFESTGINFTVINGDYQLFNEQGRDAFITKYSPNGEVIWSHQIKGNGNISISQISLDHQSNVILAGCYEGDYVQFNPRMIFNNQGSQDCFVVKIDPMGELIWTSLLGGVGEDFIEKLLVGSTGEIFVTGFYEGDYFEVSSSNKNLQITGYGLDDVYYTRLDTETGDPIWLKQIAGEFEEKLHYTHLDSRGDLVFAGEFESTELFVGDATLENYGMFFADIFLLKINQANGEIIWQKQIGGDFEDYVNGMELDSKGGAWIVGRIDHSKMFNLGEGVVYPNESSQEDAFLAHYGPDGNLLGYNFVNGNGREFIEKLVVDKKDELVVSGEYLDGTYIDLGDGKKVTFSGGDSDAFLATYHSDGSLKWKHFISLVSEEKPEYITTINLDFDDNVIVTGAYAEKFTLGNNKVFEHQNSYDSFVAKISTDGEIKWHKTLQGTNIDVLTGETHLKDQKEANIFLKAVSNSSMLTFDNLKYSNLGAEPENPDDIINFNNHLMIKLSPEGELLWIDMLKGKLTGSMITAMTLDHSEQLIIHGMFSSKTIEQPYLWQLSSTRDVLLAKYKLCDTRSITCFKPVGNISSQLKLK